ncbi:hypothetical protein CANTEDRAFT_135001 [Yamadazyma tenuis ATCC 10573]|uniref:MFS general substrate transporter n=1 Tax=Candida tenuis (strain ATCC 10573 / BCRC 21748 / CBS 615 / JCM 9827 / NBRC 10315 / NRRL Y-1498 / VKM Y-70) TaxID=590646 RepID=G3B597_CANTC|nr:uncharacterized protein CANTEDRAFT_135001 [Yamadazyma tenuis ATCC 10573]EGV63166.1 hypothetical protein CANTEDRAFT_135001 [Yamadazyma tenuis ATCC 10573]
MVSHMKACFGVAASVIALLVMTKVGSLSDQYGRKYFMVAVVLDIFLTRALKYYLLSRYDHLMFKWLVFSEALASITGVGISFFYAGVSLGPVSSSFLMEFTKKFRAARPQVIVADATINAVEPYEWDPLRLELVAFAVCSVLAIFMLPESRPEKSRRRSRSLSVISRTTVGAEDQKPLSLHTITSKVVGSITTYFSPLKLLWIPEEFKPVNYTDGRFYRERMAVILLTTCDCCLTCMSTGSGQVFMLYGILKFSWSAGTLGYVLSITFAAKAFTLIILAPFLNHFVYHKVFHFKVMKRQLDMLDFVNITVGLSVDALTLFWYPFINTTPVFLGVLGLSSFSALASPSLNSAIVKYYPDSQTGALFSAIYLVKNICNITVPVLMLTIYNYSITDWNNPGILFQIMAACLLMLVGFMFIVKRLLNLSGTSSAEVLTRTSSFSRSRSNSVAHSRSGSISSVNVTIPAAGASSDYFQSADSGSRADSEGSPQKLANPMSNTLKKNSSFSGNV